MLDLNTVRRPRRCTPGAVELLLAALAWANPNLYAQSAEGVRAQIEKALPAAEAQLGKSARILWHSPRWS